LITNFFPILIINGRPAAGKSELLQVLFKSSLEERINRFHIGKMAVFDDFPMIWTWFEEDDLLERVFRLPRLHTTTDGYFLKKGFWNLLIRRLSLDYEKMSRDIGEVEPTTAVIEFSRGSEHGGYQEAYQYLSDTILSQGACLYIRVSFEESLRKNRRRFNPDRPDSILQHGLTDQKMEKVYKYDDWEEFSSSDPEYITVRGIKTPHVIFENEDDVTTIGGSRLERRLEKTLGQLWKLWKRSRL
jgi:hypothetical protein